MIFCAQELEHLSVESGSHLIRENFLCLVIVIQLPNWIKPVCKNHVVYILIVPVKA